MTPVAILSPHLDDAVLSCWHLLAAGDVNVINVFAGVPAPGSTGWWDRTGGATDSEQRMRERIEEDRAALRLAGRRATNLPFLDDQYRSSRQELSPIIEALRTELPADAHLYAPAAIGAHRDHIAAREAALSLRDDGRKVNLYADLPHASARGWPPWVTQGAANAAEVEDQWVAELALTGISLDDMRPTVHTLTQEEHARKLAAVHTYSTQRKPLETHFGRSLADQSLLGYEVRWELAIPDRHMHPTAAKLHRRFRALGLDMTVRLLTESTRTAAQAAAAVGAELGQIVKSLVFLDNEDAPVMVLCAGDRRVDADMLELRPATVAQARSATGFAIGGIPPLGHDRELPTIIDSSLRRYQTVWCAAGTPHAVFAVETAALITANCTARGKRTRRRHAKSKPPDQRIIAAASDERTEPRPVRTNRPNAAAGRSGRHRPCPPPPRRTLLDIGSGTETRHSSPPSAARATGIDPSRAEG